MGNQAAAVSELQLKTVVYEQRRSHFTIQCFNDLLSVANLFARFILIDADEDVRRARIENTIRYSIRRAQPREADLPRFDLYIEQ